MLGFVTNSQFLFLIASFFFTLHAVMVADTSFNGIYALNSALAALETLQPRASGSLNRVDPLDSVSNY